MEEMRQSVRILHQVIDTLPGGPINVVDAKNFPPPKTNVLTKMEELIHHFIVHTEGADAPPGEIYFGHENPKGELGFYIYSKGAARRNRLKDSQPLRSATSRILSRRSCPASYDERHRRHPRLARLRDGRVRPVRGAEMGVRRS